ncbi:FlgD immunoglobulin-like domain containing protein [Lutibacter sp.]
MRTLVHGPQEAGWHSVTWQGKDRWGKTVGSGTYIFRIKAGSRVLSRKIVYLK